VAAKCAPTYFKEAIEHEVVIYERLNPIQGVHVPVHIGNIDLDQPYRYEGIAELVHVMFLSFGGTAIHQLANPNKPQLTNQVESAMRAIHALDVWHRDAAPRNILQNDTTGQVVIIDFERSEIQGSRPALGVISHNKKRKRDRRGSIVGKHERNVFTLEMGKVKSELRLM
jgi:tRNA A-37 threonylcarbamoyl transferase component Bud32